MIDPLVARCVHIALRAEWQRVELTLRPLIYDGSFVAAERPAVAVRLDEILVDLGADPFEQIPPMSDEREITAHRLASLRDVDDADDDQRRNGDERPEYGR